MAIFTGNGSAASPSITFSSDTDSGLFRVAQNRIALASNGVARIATATSGGIVLGDSITAGHDALAGTILATGSNPGQKIQVLKARNSDTTDNASTVAIELQVFNGTAGMTIEQRGLSGSSGKPAWADFAYDGRIAMQQQSSGFHIYTNGGSQRSISTNALGNVGIKSAPIAVELYNPGRTIPSSVLWSEQTSATWNNNVYTLVGATSNTGSGIYSGSGSLILASNNLSNRVISLQAAGAEQVRIAQNAVYFPTIGTTASAANAFFDNASSPANSILRSTSSLRYKRDIEDIWVEKAQAIMNLRPVWYRSKSGYDPSEWSWYGLIAEEVADVEPRLVHWVYLDEHYEEVQELAVDENGEQLYEEDEIRTPILDVDTGEQLYYIDGNPQERVEKVKTDRPLYRTVKRLKDGAKKVPDGVMYDRLPVLLLKVIQELKERIEGLEAKV